MKKNLLLILLTISAMSLQAQYKKASFLNKSGRTYDVGVRGHFVSETKATFPGIFYSYGRDQGKRLFHWFDLELLLPTKFKYNTVDINSKLPVEVSGKTKMGFIYRYNLAMYLMDPKKESKLKPFVIIGLNAVISGTTAKTYETKSVEDYPSPTKIPVVSGFSAGGNIGAGAIYNFTEKLGLKLNAGYNLQTLLKAEDNIAGYEFISIYGSHPYASIGLRFTMLED